ncbi:MULTISPECIES: MFS transporter [Gordonia]|uniref:Putative major facilitator superfamily transporter n=1 Tax=Gordonia sihwensis NBRC 108236 TaxID=1223544 RepID=L7LQP8_9ACTN|nr:MULTISPECIES: MFS transporter [Gordonia]AUH70387.1 MFS transporter [Gordonia sp. YC-JH1]MBY4569840.1 MFS transporter [Gordonia sihwensis]WFN94398.1 MFS transporter [Gordonia sihwensis]GAC62487.1 putative major facilitator superfamily transporter [Gordonia sihwensis NBRC 108236]
MISAPARRGAVLATAFAFLVTMMGTTLPTPLYSLYSQRLDFTEFTVTILFAVYAFGVMFALIVFGRLSDQIGRRPILLTALVLAVISAVMFLLPLSLPLLIAARIVSGLSAGLMSGTGTAAVIDLFGPADKARAGMLAIAVNTGGLGVGTLFAGVVADLSSAPLTLPYAVHLGLSVLAFVTLRAFTPAPADPAPLRLQAPRLTVPAPIRGAFVRGVLAAGAGFAVCGVLTAVSALFLVRYLGIGSHTVAGLVVFLAFAFMVVGQFVARRISSRAAMQAGCGGLVVAAAVLAVALSAESLAALLIAPIVLGVSAGLCVNAGLAATVERVDPAQRGAVSSAFFAGLYLMLAVPAIGVGALSLAIGLRESGLVFAGLVALLAAAVGVADIAARGSAARATPLP